MKKDFLDQGREIPLDAAVTIINAEVQWCHRNPMLYVISEDFFLGFIAGLKQAKHLIIKLSEMEYEE